MMTGVKRSVRSVLWPVISSLVFFALAFKSIELSVQTEDIVTIWPASGVLVASLMLTTDRRKLWFLSGAFLASLAANMLTGAPWHEAIGYSLGNMTEALLAVYLATRRGADVVALDKLTSVVRFVAAAMIAAAWSATLASVVKGEWSWIFTGSWFLTVTLGILIGTPVVIAGWQAVFLLRRSSYKGLGEGLALMAGHCALTAAVFAQPAYPILFLPMLGVLIATYRRGPFGAAGSILVVAVIGSIATLEGSGPIQMPGTGVIIKTLFFQFYLLVLLGAALPLAALLAQRDSMVARIQRGQRLLELAGRAAEVGHWRIDVIDKATFWSGEVFRMHGRDPALPPPGPSRALADYVEEDRPLIANAIAETIATARPFNIDARLIRRDGGERHVNIRGEAELAADGTLLNVFGMIADITSRVHAARALDTARKEAETKARDAALLAETDQLTGIANRRKALSVLDQAIADARVSDTPLSIALLDIDHFKSINDRFGHAAGDAVLTRVAGVCRTALRDSDLVGRIGGEEFVIVLPGAASSVAMAVAERVRESIEFSATGELAMPVTASLGIASLHPGMDAKHLLEAADEALYLAKRDGRNLLRIAQPEALAV